MQPEDIDKLFRDRLEGHAPTPPAYLWNQLEEELQPAKKRPVLWMWAAAAAVALLLVSGVLWLQLTPGAGSASAPLATSTTRPARTTSAVAPAAVQPEKKSVAAATPQATVPAALASTPSKAAATEAPSASLRQPEGARPKAQQRLAASPVRSISTAPSVNAMTAPEALAATSSKAQPERSSPKVEVLAPSQPPTALALAATPSVPTGPIEVEVHRSTETAAVASAGTEGNSRPRLGSILLRQARNVVSGERVSLAETGLPETVTVQARVGNRTLTKVIQL